MGERRRPGEVREAIVEYLSQQLGDARATEIHDAVKSTLGPDVPASSVRSYLRLNAGSLFDRTGYGRYRLRPRP